jgi:hypothetical protein
VAVIKQYVNLTAKEGEKDRGNKPTVEATPKSKKKFFSFKRKVQWEITPTGDANVDTKYLSKAERAQVDKEETKESDGKFTNEVLLPHVGKDKYKVTVKKKGDEANLLEIEYETWRKIYYSVWLMNDKCKGIFANIKDKFHAAFEPAGIELELKGEFDCKADETSTIMPADADFYDLPSIYPDNTADVEDMPFHLKIAFVNDLSELKDRALDRRVEKTDTDNTKDRWVEDLDAGSRPASKGEKTVSELNALESPASGDAYVLKDAGKLTKGNLKVKSGQLVKWSGSAWELNVGRWVAHIKLDDPLGAEESDWKKEVKAEPSGGSAKTLANEALEKVAEKEVKVLLHKDAGLNAELDRGKRVTVSVTLGLVVAGGCCGYSIGNFVVCRSKDPETSILQTFTHEIGHGLQQVVKTVNKYKANGSADGTETNTLWHTDDYGGQGPHCQHNTEVADSTKTTSGKTYVHKAGKLCTMYYADHAEVDADGKFCPTCEGYLRRTNLSAKAMKKKGWLWYK